MILFVHTPKCGGKSIRDALKDAYPDRLKLYYLNPRKHHSWPLVPFILRPSWPDTARIDIVYGHFCFDQFALYGLFRPVRKGMFFRHPLDLVCSSYFYRREKHADEFRNVTLLDYAKSPDMQNLFGLFLGKTRVESLDFIGLQEHFDASVDLYAKIFGKQLAVHRVNETRHRPADYRQYLESEGLLKPVLQIQKKNIATYEKALIRFQELKAAFP